MPGRMDGEQEWRRKGGADRRLRLWGIPDVEEYGETEERPEAGRARKLVVGITKGG